MNSDLTGNRTLPFEILSGSFSVVQVVYSLKFNRTDHIHFHIFIRSSQI